jgi:uncharacterized membrane protein YfcA
LLEELAEIREFASTNACVFILVVPVGSSFGLHRTGYIDPGYFYLFYGLFGVFTAKIAEEWRARGRPRFLRRIMQIRLVGYYPPWFVKIV